MELTRAETIKQLEIELSMWESDCKSYHKTKDALKKAIELLKQEPFMNKPCVSGGVCEHDKMQMLDKIRAEIKALSPEPTAFDVIDGNPIKDAVWETIADVVTIIDKYREESKND